MLHLAIIGIVCAVSALNGGTTFIEQKNNVTFYRTQDQTVTTNLSDYNANSSGCAGENITNRNNFLYKFFIKQCKNNSSPNMDNAVIDNPINAENFPIVKRKLSWSIFKPALKLKTLSPQCGVEQCQCTTPCNTEKKRKKCKRVKFKPKFRKPKKQDKCDLNCQEKQMLFLLKNYKYKPLMKKIHKKHIHRKDGSHNNVSPSLFNNLNFVQYRNPLVNNLAPLNFRKQFRNRRRSLHNYRKNIPKYRKRHGNLKIFKQKFQTWPLLQKRLKRFDDVTTIGQSSSRSTTETETNDEATTSLDMSTEDTKSSLISRIPSHTLERPFLKRECSKNIKQNLVKNTVKFQSLYRGLHLNHKTKLPNNKYLSPYRYLKIRHALRHYLIRNNAWVTSKDQRKKRCGCCPTPCRSWRTAPLLCIPYIKKGQDDVLKYLIKIIQNMIGKPFPPKRNIFDNTKFIPCVRKEPQPPCEDADDDESSGETRCSSICGPNSKQRLPHGSLKPCPTKPPCPKAISSVPQKPANPTNAVMISTTPNSPNDRPCFAAPTSKPCSEPSATQKPATTAMTNSVKQDTAQKPCNEMTTTANIQKPPQNGGTDSPTETNTQPVIYVTHMYYGAPGPNAPNPNAPNPNSFYTSNPNPNPVSEMSTKPFEYQKLYPSSGLKWPYGEASMCFPKFPFFVNQMEQYINQRSNQCRNATTETSVTPNSINWSTQATVTTSQAMVTPTPATNNECLSSPESPNAGAQAPTAPVAVAIPVTGPSTVATAKQEQPNTWALYNTQPSMPENKYFTPLPSDEIMTVESETEVYTLPELKYSTPVTKELQNEEPTTKQSQLDFGELKPVMAPKLTDSHNLLGLHEYITKNKKHFRENDVPFLDYPLGAMKNEDAKLSKTIRENNLRKAMEYDDYLLNQLPMKNFEENFKNYRRLLKKKYHRKTSNQKLQEYKSRPRVEYPSYDYNDNLDYLLNLNHRSHRKDNMLTAPRLFWKGVNEKIKKQPQDSYIRKKRGNDYNSWPEIFESYNDYLDDFNSLEENSKKEVGGDHRNQSDWTPPNYDMFNELAEEIQTTTTSVMPENTTVETTTISSSENSTKNYSATTKPPKEISSTLSNKNTTDIKNENTTSSPKCTTTTDSMSIKTTTSEMTHSTTLSLDTTTTATPSKTYTHTTTPINYKTTTKDTTEFTTTKPTQEKNSDCKKSGKNVQKLSKGVASNTGFFTTVGNLKKDSEEYEELDSDQYLDMKEGKMPTTLKAAVIVKGPKKMLAKPSPKVYSRVYPDSFPFELEINETVATTAPNCIANKTALLSSTPKPDVRLQLLAVCEGYLEVVKLIKAQNQTIGEDLDADLARYCESIISQSFNSQSDKPKKPELSEPLSYKTTGNNLKNAKATIRSAYASDEDLRLHEKIFEDLLNDPVYKRELVERIKDKNNDDSDYMGDYVSPGYAESSEGVTKSIDDTEASKDQVEVLEKEDLLNKGITKEQVELINLLRKRKRALLNWLFNTKEQVKSGDVQETEYFDDEDLIAPEPDMSGYSGTIKPKRKEKTNGIANTNSSFADESIFPVYAKQYGYDKGGEIREVEVLWRKVNEETHEEEILKNLSVLALLLTSTISPNVIYKDTKLVGSGLENEESETELKGGSKINFAGDPQHNPSTTTTQSSNKTSTTPKPTVPCANASKTKQKKKNGTVTFMNKPDTSSIVGTPPNVTKTCTNTTHKPSHKFGVAKDIFQEYTIEFLNYAVYILPIMFTILFLFCCTCCALHILKTKKSIKRLKKKRKQLLSTDDTTETSDESERSRKKRKWRKKKNKSDENETLEKKRSKKFWNVLKLPSRTSRDFNDSEKKKYFLRFLKSRKGDNADVISAPIHELDEYSKKYAESVEEVKAHESDFGNEKMTKKKDEDHSEAAERRELIALLEELKKIETGQTEEKKEVKSVHVQYTTQQDENSGFRHPDFSCPYHKFGLLPFYEKGHKNLELYEDVDELTELLPCEHNFYSKRNAILGDFRINEKGRCQRFLKIVHNSNANRAKLFTDRKFDKNTDFTYKNINTDTSEDLMEVTMKNMEAHKLPYKETDGFVEEMENFKRQLNKKKNVRLKDDGVLCRL